MHSKFIHSITISRAPHFHGVPKPNDKTNLQGLLEGRYGWVQSDFGSGGGEDIPKGWCYGRKGLLCQTKLPD